MKRSKFPALFWTGNIIEILERFSYYGLYMGFQIYATTQMTDGGLGWSKTQLGAVQTLFLVLSYGVPMISGILADRYGFKIMLLISYVLYLPGFLFLLVTRQYWLVILVMSLIAVAAGIFKPLIAGTVRLTSDKTNLTLGFGIFYLMVNVGAFIGPMTAGALRTKHWNYAFLASAVGVVLMIFITAIWYRNPIDPEKNGSERVSLGKHFMEIIPFLKQGRILVFIIIFGVFIEIPFWAFFNITPMFVDTYVRTDILYNIFVGILPEKLEFIVGWFSKVDESTGVHRIAGETLGHTALYIIIFQMVVTRGTEKLRSMPTLAIGIGIMLLGCIGLFYSTGNFPLLMFLGTVLFAIGEMACMPRFEQYLITLLPPEKTGLGGGLLRIPIVIGAFSGITITPLYGVFEQAGSPQSVWLVIGGMLLVGLFAILIYDRAFKVQT